MSHWAAVRCHFRCSQCLRVSPVNALDFDGEVECLRCGALDELELGQWIDALAHARSVADGSTPIPAGERFATHGTDELRPHSIQRKTLVMRARPGLPPCPGCSAALRVDRSLAGMLVVACPQCDWKGTFVLPRGVRQCEPRLAGAIAAAHARGAREATLGANKDGAGVVHCPHCSGPVSHEAHATIARCEYCRVTVRMPSAALRNLGHDLEPELWWLYFSA